jgi:hypothetical protein
MPRSAEFFGAHGLVKVAGTVDGVPFTSAFMAIGDGTHKLPMKAVIRRALGEQAGGHGHGPADRAPVLTGAVRGYALRATRSSRSR